MKSLHEFKGVFLHKDPVDMRKAINGLSVLVQNAAMGDLMGPYLFVFCGRRRDLIKILYFDKSGFALWQKRLETERFIWPKKLSDEVIHISTEQLSWLLDGYDVWRMRPFAELKFAKVS
jgi:transposase